MTKALKKTGSEALVGPRASSKFSKAEDLRAAGKQLRDTVPFEAHGPWRAEKGRTDPIDILRAADATRLPDQCLSATAGCCSRRSLSTAGPLPSWLRTCRERRPPESMSRLAATRI
jgi:hypothetical protein